MGFPNSSQKSFWDFLIPPFFAILAETANHLFFGSTFCSPNPPPRMLLHLFGGFFISVMKKVWWAGEHGICVILMSSKQQDMAGYGVILGAVLAFNGRDSLAQLQDSPLAGAAPALGLCPTQSRCTPFCSSAARRGVIPPLLHPACDGIPPAQCPLPHYWPVLSPSALAVGTTFFIL